MTDKPTKMLILHIEVPGVWADDLDQSAAVWAAEDEMGGARLAVVTEEWCRADVVLTLLAIPGEKSDEQYELLTYKSRIVGAETRPL